MARLILKSPYIKSTGGASGYLRYIATRERVELIPDDRPPTRKQEQLIAKLVKDFPDSKVLYEYEDYLTKPTKVNASAFITLALEANWDSIHESEQYMKYIGPPGHAPSASALTVCSVMRMQSLWRKPWKNWRTTPEMCGRISSLSSGRMLLGSASTTPRRGEISSGRTATTSRRQ